MTNDPLLDITRGLAAERRAPIPTDLPTVTREPSAQQIADLQQIIHLLAMAMTDGKAVA